MDKFINPNGGKFAITIDDENNQKVFDPKTEPYIDNCYLCKKKKPGTLSKLQLDEAYPHYHFLCLDCQRDAHG